VRRELADPDPGMTEAGANEHLRLLGRLEHDKETALSNDPDVGATLTVNVPEFPEPMVTDDALVANVRPLLEFVPEPDPEPDPEPPPEPDPLPEPEPLPHVSVVLTPLEILFVMLGLPTACT